MTENQADDGDGPGKAHVADSGTQLWYLLSNHVKISGASAPPNTPAMVYAREAPVDRRWMPNCSVTNAACGPYMNEWNIRPIVMPTMVNAYDPPSIMTKKMADQIT